MLPNKTTVLDIDPIFGEGWFNSTHFVFKTLPKNRTQSWLYWWFEVLTYVSGIFFIRIDMPNNFIFLCYTSFNPLKLQPLPRYTHHISSHYNFIPLHFQPRTISSHVKFSNFLHDWLTKSALISRQTCDLNNHVISLNCAQQTTTSKLNTECSNWQLSEKNFTIVRLIANSWQFWSFSLWEKWKTLTWEVLISSHLNFWWWREWWWRWLNPFLAAIT